MLILLDFTTKLWIQRVALFKGLCDVFLFLSLLGVMIIDSKSYAKIGWGLYMSAYLWLVPGFILSKTFKPRWPLVFLGFTVGLQSLGAMVLLIVSLDIRGAPFRGLFITACSMFFTWFTLWFVYVPFFVIFLKPAVYAAWLATFEDCKKEKRTWKMVYVLISVLTFLTPFRD